MQNQKIHPVRDVKFWRGQKIEKISNGVHLSIIIPAYNEEKRLPKTLTEIDNYLKTKDFESEIIVVSDGSTDKTAEIVRDLTTKIKNLKLIEFKKRQGKGFGVKIGILEAQGEYRIFTDADNSTSIDQIEKMWPHFEKGYDIVIGSRDIKGAVLAVSQPWIRKIVLGEGFKLLRKIIIGLWKIQDTQCGFKCFTEKAAKDVFLKITINRFGFDPEALVIAKKLGYKIKEIPIIWMNDIESKVKFKNIIEMFFELLKVRLNLILRKYEKKEEVEKAVWKKSDLISILIIGEMVAWLTLALLKTLKLDPLFYQTVGFKINLGLILAIFVPPAALICLYITYLLEKKVSVIFQAGKFVAVGILNTLIDWGILAFQMFLTGITAGLYYSIFKGVSFLTAVINSYFWNKFWTFKKKKTGEVKKEFLQFLVVSLIGLCINVGIASLTVNIISAPTGISPEVWGIFGAVAATVFSMAWNFIGYKFIVFK